MSRIYAVEYRYVTDQDEEMAKMRPSHRAFNGRLADRGLLLAAGPSTKIGRASCRERV